MSGCLFILKNVVLLVYGIMLSYSLAGVTIRRRSVITAACLITLCGGVQLGLWLRFDQELVRQLYPFIIHLPLMASLVLCHGERLTTVLAAVTTSYLCCQPAKWVSLLMEKITGVEDVGTAAYIVIMLVTGVLVIRYLAPVLSQIYHKETYDVLIFGLVPIVYYVFDYSMTIYTDFWTVNDRVAAEFLPFFLCLVHLVFCVVYYEQIERKEEFERKAYMTRLALEQQTREFSAIKQTEEELRMLRHDLRLIMGNLAVSIQQGDEETAMKLIDGYVERVEATAIHRYCTHDAVNYMLNHFENRCRAEEVEFVANIELPELTVDEIMFTSILSNALDNALNAQKELPASLRAVRVLIKMEKDKLLLSVKNPCKTVPQFVDGRPITRRKGHGYGTQSIRHMTEQLGGACRFEVQDQWFITRVVI